MKNRDGPQLRIVKNVVENLPPSIAFLLRGTKSNRDAIGAAVTVETASGRQTRMLQAGSGFLSQHSKEVFFGLGDANDKDSVRASIRWPSGLLQNLHDLPVNHRVWVEEGTDTFRLEAFNTSRSMPGQFAGAPPQEAQALPTAVETWLLAPVPAPNFSLPELTGVVRTLATLRGSPVLLYFWVTQSATCQEDLKAFNRVYGRWTTQGLGLLTVNFDTPANVENLKELAREQRLSLPILRGSDDVAGIYNILYRYLLVMVKSDAYTVGQIKQIFQKHQALSIAEEVIE